MKSKEEQLEKSEVKSVPLWGSCRLTYTICAFFTTLNLILMRFNLSFALVCMVKPTHHNTSSYNYTRNEDCPALNASYTEDNVYNEWEFEWSKQLQGRLLSGFFYGYMVSQVFGGWFSDRFGGKLMFILGNANQSALTLLIPLVTRWNVEGLFWIRVLQGVVSGFSLPSMYQLYSKWSTPTERTTLMGAAYAGFPLGNCIIFPLSSFLCQYGFAGGWPSVFYVTGSFGMICCLSFCFLVYDDANSHPRISKEEREFLNVKTGSGNMKKGTLVVPWKSIAVSIPVHAYNVAHFCQTWGFITLAVNLPLFMKEVLYFNIHENGLLSAMPYAGVIVIRIFIGYSFDYFRKRGTISVTNLRKVYHGIGTIIPGISMLSMGLLSCHNQYIAVAIISLGQAIADFGFVGGYLLSYLDLAPQFSGLLTGISNTIGVIPGFVTPTLVGYITTKGTRDEWMLVLYIAAGFYFLGGLVYTAIGSSELQPWAMPKSEEEEVEEDGDGEKKQNLLNKKMEHCQTEAVVSQDKLTADETTQEATSLVISDVD